MLKEFVEAFKALGEPTRMKIVKLLSTGELCVCELEATLLMSQPRISQHLKILKHAGLVQERKDGRWVYYSLNDAYLKAILDDFRKFLGEDLAQLYEFREEYARFAQLDCNETVRSCRDVSRKSNK